MQSYDSTHKMQIVKEHQCVTHYWYLDQNWRSIIDNFEHTEYTSNIVMKMYAVVYIQKKIKHPGDFI